MGTKARALYDFTSEPGTRELSIAAGEILDVINTEVGEGWWEGSNSKGQSGLFPAAYVETISTGGPPERPPPVLPPQAALNRYDQADDDWGNNAQYATGDFAKGGDDGWDDDWDDDTYSEIGPGQTQPHQQQTQNTQKPPPYTVTAANDYPLPGMPIQEYNNDDAVSNYAGSNTGTVVRKNKFASFTKTGGESYLLGTFNVQISDSDKVYIVQEGDAYIWNPITQPYTVVVASPKKESKFKGIKSFIAYQLTPSFNNIQVSRRYKHFDWLHERLTEKFCMIPIPPLPDKQISGRYEEQFIEHRRIQLQEFVDWVCRHPVLSRCDVWQHFLSCTDEKRWKAGKRQAEKDLLVGANYCITVCPPEKALLQSYVEQQTDQCNNFIHAMDTSVKNLMATCYDQTKKQQNAYKREFQKIGESFFSLGNAISLDEGAIVSTSKLTAAIRMTGGAYIEIGRMFEEQPKYDWERLGDKLHIYKGIIGSYPDVLSVHKSAIQKRKECEKQTSDHKMEVVQLNEVIRRTDVVSYALIAEINHFKSERTIDLNSAVQQFLKQQIHFYKKIVEKLESTLQHYEQ